MIFPPVAFELQTTCLLSPAQLVILDLDQPSSVASELVATSAVVVIIEAITAIEVAITTTFVVAVRQFIVANAEQATHHGLSFLVLAFPLQAFQHHSFT